MWRSPMHIRACTVYVCVWIHRYLAGLRVELRQWQWQWQSALCRYHCTSAQNFGLNSRASLPKLLAASSSRPVVVRFINLHIESPSVVARGLGAGWAAPSCCGMQRTVSLCTVHRGTRQAAGGIGGRFYITSYLYLIRYGGNGSE